MKCVVDSIPGRLEKKKQDSSRRRMRGLCWRKEARERRSKGKGCSSSRKESAMTGKKFCTRRKRMLSRSRKTPRKRKRVKLYKEIRSKAPSRKNKANRSTSRKRKSRKKQQGRPKKLYREIKRRREGPREGMKQKERCTTSRIRYSWTLVVFQVCILLAPQVL